MESKGKSGEELASQYLQDQGYQLLERNWSLGQKEIDIIADNGEQLIIAEVKTQKNKRFGSPEFRVNRTKQRHLVQAANAYIMKNGIQREVRFDILAVISDGNKEEVHHIPAAFGPRW